ncbi:hypothetical protein ASD15_11355 [Massilia sp. Root351]|nr:hypothetical protein ASD15_11355 [Massilia sp. Root351]
MPSSLFRLLLLFSVFALAAARTAASPLPGYAHTAWNGQRGAPSDVLQFTQTPDGWLWLSSPNGLFRFDGVDFQRMDSVQGHRLRSASVLGLLTTRDGRLWVGDRFGGISVFGARRMSVFTETEGLPRGAVMTMTEGPDGSVWAATSTGLAYLAPGAARFQRVGRQEGLPEARTRQVLFGRGGRQWVSVEGGIYYRDPGQAGYRRAWPYIDMMAMAEAPDGTLWGSDGVDKHYRVLTRPPPGNPAPLAELGGNGALFDRDGNMWILKVDALERRQAPYVGQAADARRLTKATGLSGPLPQTAFEDREGNLWIGTSAGLDRLRRTRMRSLPVEKAFDRPGVIGDAREGVIIGDWRQPVRRYSPGGAIETLEQMRLSCAYRARDGSLWLANNQERRVRSPSGAVTRLPHPEHLRGLDIQAMTVDGAGRMWASVSRQGVFLIEDGDWRKAGGLQGMPDGTATALATDRAGRVWAGYLRNRIALIDGARVQVFGQDDGLDLGNVQSLLADGPRLWAGGQNGLAWYDGQRWHSVRPADGQVFRGISGMARTAAGELWLHGSDGVTRIAAADLEHLVRVPGQPLSYERFNALDGLVGSAEQLRPLPSLTQSQDGRLWFASASDVSSIDPARIARNRLAPPVEILSLRSGEISHPVRNGLQLPTGSRDLQIAYTALGLAVPERVNFRYKLEGVDERWQNAGTRREAFYTNLRPGAYRFQVLAANEDGVWNEAGATLELQIPPRFVETGWFTMLLVLLGAMLLAGLYWLRMRHLTFRMRDLMQERLAERQRIARGLHDTLLQSVQGLIIFFDNQASKLPLDSEERGKVEQTLELADALMSEGRDCISDLRAASEPEDLGQRLIQYGSVMLHDRFQATIHGEPRVLVPRVYEEVHAIAREALFNAARHAHACQVQLILDYRPDALIVMVRDNGCGIPPTQSPACGPPGHYGLVGMRERAAAIGAAYTLVSAPGKGTSAHLEVPGERAYPGQRSAALFTRLLQRRRAAGPG